MYVYTHTYTQPRFQRVPPRSSAGGSVGAEQAAYIKQHIKLIVYYYCYYFYYYYYYYYYYYH